MALRAGYNGVKKNLLSLITSFFSLGITGIGDGLEVDEYGDLIVTGGASKALQLLTTEALESNTGTLYDVFGNSTLEETTSPATWYKWRPLCKQYGTPDGSPIESHIMALNEYWGIHFKDGAKCVKKIRIGNYWYGNEYNTCFKEFYFEGSNNGENYTRIGTYEFYDTKVAAFNEFDIDNDNYYTYYRIIAKSSNDSRNLVIFRSVDMFGYDEEV